MDCLPRLHLIGHSTGYCWLIHWHGAWCHRVRLELCYQRRPVRFSQCATTYMNHSAFYGYSGQGRLVYTLASRCTQSTGGIKKATKNCMWIVEDTIKSSSLMEHLKKVTLNGLDSGYWFITGPPHLDCWDMESGMKWNLRDILMVKRALKIIVEDIIY